MAQVIGAELQLEAVGGAGLFRPHDAGVVDQQIDLVVAPLELITGPADGFQ